VGVLVGRGVERLDAPEATDLEAEVEASDRDELERDVLELESESFVDWLVLVELVELFNVDVDELTAAATRLHLTRLVD